MTDPPLEAIRRPGVPVSASSTRSPCTSRARASTTPTTGRRSARARRTPHDERARRRARRATSARAATPPRASEDRSAKTESKSAPRRSSSSARRARRAASSSALGAATSKSKRRQDAGVGAEVDARRQEAPHLRLLDAPRGPGPRPCRGPRVVRRARDRQRAEEAEQRRPAHVRAQRLGRAPGDQRQPDERHRRQQPALHRADDLLLAPRARQVVLVAVARVLARAGERQRLLAVDVRLAGRQAQRVAAVPEAAVDPRDDAAAAVRDAAHRVDERREVLEADDHHVVDVDPRCRPRSSARRATVPPIA